MLTIGILLLLSGVTYVVVAQLRRPPAKDEKGLQPGMTDGDPGIHDASMPADCGDPGGGDGGSCD